MNQPEAVYTANGTPGTKGVCSVCDTKMFKMGRTPAHEHVPPPDPATLKKRKKAARAKKRKGKLVIVESPAKARTVGKFLGRNYVVRASVGHVRDLLRSQLSVDVENDFVPKYRVPKEKRQVVNELKDAFKGTTELYLATDPDREGEAIAWHLVELIGLKFKKWKPGFQRIVFHEITENAVNEAIKHPRDLDLHLIDAEHRLAMVRLAIAEQPRFEADDCELRRAGPSYTIQTVETFRDRLGPDDHVFWLIGGDSLPELAGWYRIEQLNQLCQIVTASRPGFEAPALDALAQRLGADGVARIRSGIIETPRIDISASAIRGLSSLLALSSRLQRKSRPLG